MEEQQLPLFQEDTSLPTPYPELEDPAEAFDLRKVLPFIVRTAAQRASEDFLKRYPELRQEQEPEPEG